METAVCVVGLYRTFASTARSIATNVLHGPHLTFFGVAADAWKDVPARIPFATLVNQSACDIRVPPQYAPTAARANYQQSLCNLERCEALISTAEAARGAPFVSAMLLRLDLFWETKVSAPTSMRPGDLHVPSWNGCGGVCDKFAVGGRHAMRVFFTRGRHVFTGHPRYSEHFLADAVHQHRRDVAVFRHAEWVFCKMKRPGWGACTRRVTRNETCEHGFACPWCGRGCSCRPATARATPRGAPPGRR